MNILFLGPQGSGKGTQARLLSEKYNLFYFDSGAFLRELSKNNEVVRETLNKGSFVPNEEMASYVASFLDEKGLYDGIVFDGFPRDVEQYQFFKNWLNQKKIKLDVAFVLNIDETTTVKRLSGRRMDPTTGEIYNLVTDLPPASVDKEKLVQREDDKPEAIKRRLEVYKKVTVPLINEFQKEIKVVKVNAEGPISDIQKQIIKEVEKIK